MKKVIIFGGEGYIGRVVKKYLIKKNYKVTSYEISMKVGQFNKSFNKKGNKFDDEIRGLIRKLKSGSLVSITKIRAKGDDGVKFPPPIAFTIQ